MVKKTDPCETASDSAQRSESVKQTYNRTTLRGRHYYNLYYHFIKRSYEEPYKWYYIVFKPFNDTYDINKYQYPLGTCSDYIRSMSDSFGISTREIDSNKIHVNSLMVSTRDMLSLHGRNITKRGLKYKLHVEHVSSLEHRMNVLSYMFKEADEREFVIYKDHVAFDKEPQRTVQAKPQLHPDDPDNQPPPKRNLFLTCCNNNKLKFVI